MKKSKLFIKSISCILVLLIVFYAIPSTVFAELSEIGADSSSADGIGYDVGLVGAAPEVYEITEMREESVKTFRLSDGSFVAAKYPSAVHRKDSSGNWQDIDNTLTDKGSEISTSDARVKFAKKITGNGSLFTLHENNTKISFSLNGATKKTEGKKVDLGITDDGTELGKLTTLSKLSSKIIYEEILDGVDIEYVVTSNDIKENIIVKEKRDSYEYTFTVALNNLTAALTSEGDVIISDYSGNTAYTIPAPVIYDADGEFAPDGVGEYVLTDHGNGKYTLTVTVLAEWMNATDRAFPVTVDPTLGYGEATGEILSLNINSAFPDETGTGDELWVGYTNGTVGTPESNESIAYFKIADIPNIPSDAYVTEALFTLYVYYNTDIDITVHNVTTPWDSTLTWNKVFNSDQPQGSFSDDPIIAETLFISNCEDYYGEFYIIYNDYSTSYEIDVTEAAKQWFFDGGNNGVAIKRAFHDEDIPDYNAFASLWAISEDYHPTLTVSYYTMSGLEDYYATSSHSTGSTGVGTVNLGTGNLVTSIPTLSTTDSIMPFTPTLVKSSMGEDWRFNMEQSLDAYYVDDSFSSSFPWYPGNDDPGEIDYYVWHDGDGSEHYFYPTEIEGYFADDDGLLLVLFTDDNGAVKIQDSSKTVYRFNEELKLDRIRDRVGNRIEFHYDESGNIIEIEFTPWCGIDDETFVYSEYDEEFNIDYATPEELETPVIMLRIEYDGTKPKYVYNAEAGDAVLFRYTGDMLTEVERITLASSITADSANEVISAYYNSNSNNSGVYVYESATLTYGDGKITGITESKSGYGISYTYDGTRVKTVTESANGATGQKMSFDFKATYTDVRSSGADDVYGNSDDTVTRYIFDEKGRVRSTYSSDASGTVIYGAVTGEYVTQDNIKNNLKKVVNLNGVGTNLLLNGGFEEEGFAHWIVSDNVKQSYIGGGNDYYRAKIPYGSATEESIKQYVKLDEGTYNLSFNVYSSEEYGCSIRVEITSLINNSVDNSVDNSEILDEQVALNSAYTVASASDSFSKSFTVSGKNGTGEDKLCVAIYVYGNTTLQNKSVIIDDVMLSEGVGASELSLVEMGSFEDTNIDHLGNSGAAVLSKWDYIQASAGYSLVNSESVFGQVLKLNSAGESSSSIGQRIYTRQENAYGKYTYTVSGFAKAENFICSDSCYFRIAVCIDGEYHYYDFQPDCTDWQFVNGSFTVTNPNYIDVYVEYGGQLNSYALFDNISVALSANNTEYTYYANGMPKLMQGKFYSEYYEYSSDLELTRKITSDRDEYVYTYDNAGNLRSESHYTFTNGFYDALRTNFRSLNKTLKSNTQYSYNLQGLRTQVVISTSGSNSKDITESYEYSEDPNIFGTLISVTDSLDRTVRYFHDSRDGKLLATVNEGTGDGTAYEYDVFDRLTKTVPASYSSYTETYTSEENAEQVEYEYDSNNRLSEITTKSTVYTFTYDDFGNSTEIKAGNNTLASYVYNGNNGKLEQVIYGNGYTETYEYNELELLDKVRYNENGGENALLYSYEYTAAGELTRINDHSSGRSTVFTYSTNGKVRSAREFSTDTMYSELTRLYAYDDQGRVISATYELLYDDAGEEHTYKSIDNEYTYTDGGNLTSSTNGGLTTSYIYDGYSRLTGFTRSKPGFSNTVTYTFSEYGNNTSLQVNGYTSVVNDATTTYAYTYDDNGNITKVVYNGSTQIRYYYDNLSQLIREDNGLLGKTFVYTYDNAGNILSKKTYSLTAENAAPENLISTDTYGYTDGWGDLLTSYNGVTISYDEIGNPLTYYNGFTFEWLGRQLTKATNGENEYLFAYNSDGLRTTKTVNGVTTNYYYSGSQLIAEETDGNITVYVYDAAGSVIGMQYHAADSSSTAWDSYWFEKNLHGDVVAIYDNSGTKLITYTYDAWGNFSLSKNSDNIPAVVVNNPFTYRGYYYDYDLGLYYLQSRYYDSNTGRFISADSYVSTSQGLLGYNMYAYCNNNPVMYIDKSGESSIKLVDLYIFCLCYVFSPLFTLCVLAGNCFAVYTSEKAVADDSIEPMDEEKFNSYANNKPTYGMTREEQIAYIRRYRENTLTDDIKENDAFCDNWTEAEMLREISYHDKAYAILNNIGLGQTKWAGQAGHVDFEDNQTLRTYAFRIVGNVLP